MMRAGWVERAKKESLSIRPVMTTMVKRSRKRSLNTTNSGKARLRLSVCRQKPMQTPPY